MNKYLTQIIFSITCFYVVFNWTTMWNEFSEEKILSAITVMKEKKLKTSSRGIATFLKKSNSFRSVWIILKRLQDKGIIKLLDKGYIEILNPIHNTDIKTRDIPILWEIACWQPIYAQESIKGYIAIDEQIVKPHNQYFLLRAEGDSMNMTEDNISDGDIVLIKSQNTAKNGDIVCALLDDSATLKIFKAENWVIKLLPKSDNTSHTPIILEEGSWSYFAIQGIYVMNLWKI